MSNSPGEVSESALLLQKLVQIESINPALPGGERGEIAILEYVEELLKGEGIACERLPVTGDRYNLIASIEGSREGGSVILESHLDTVTVLNMTREPFDGEIKDGKLYGRGSCDTKGSATSMIQVLRKLNRTRDSFRGKVYWVGAVDEEFGMKGAAALGEWIAARQAEGEQFDVAIIGEPTLLEPVVAHKGGIHQQLEIRGKAAHGSRPELGRNAVVLMSKVIQELEERYVPMIAKRDHPLTGAATLNVGRIEGGLQANAVPAVCSLMLDRRTAPQESVPEAFEELKEFITGVVSQEEGFSIEFDDSSYSFESVDTPVDSPVVADFVAACRQVNEKAEPSGVTYGTDASRLKQCSIPLIVFGPGDIAHAHSEVELIELSELEQAIEILHSFCTDRGAGS